MNAIWYVFPLASLLTCQLGNAINIACEGDELSVSNAVLNGGCFIRFDLNSARRHKLWIRQLRLRPL